MLARYGMINSTDTALNQRPESFECVHMRIALNINLLPVVNPLMSESVRSQRIVHRDFIRIYRRGRENTLNHVRHQRCSSSIGNNPRDYAPAALYCSPYWLFINWSAPLPFAFIGMLESVFTAYVGFVRFYFACKVADIFLEHSSNLVEHSPRGFIGNSQFPLKLFSGDAASGACHQVHGVKPQVQRSGRLVIDRSRCGVQMMTTRGARPRLTLLFSRVADESAYLVALRAMRVLAIWREAITPQLLQASFIVWKLPHELHQGVA